MNSATGAGSRSITGRAGWGCGGSEGRTAARSWPIPKAQTSCRQVTNRRPAVNRPPHTGPPAPKHPTPPERPTYTNEVVSPPARDDPIRRVKAWIEGVPRSNTFADTWGSQIRSSCGCEFVLVDKAAEEVVPLDLLRVHRRDRSVKLRDGRVGRA